MIEVMTLSEITIDGRLSLGWGRSSKELFAFGSDELRIWFHAQRAWADAIMVGANTIRTDDPELTVRYAPGDSPLRIVVTTNADLPFNSIVLSDGRPTLVATTMRASMSVVDSLTSRAGVEVVRCGEATVDLPELMTVLSQRAIKRLVVEGGSTLLGALFRANLVTRIAIKHIPIIAGDAAAPTFLGSGKLPSLSRWLLDEWFVQGGVGISTYIPWKSEA